MISKPFLPLILVDYTILRVLFTPGAKLYSLFHNSRMQLS